ncbi:MAG: hypothetical protein IJI73_03080 [Kiritimatiellae bacterium]|nr:hypothetical protein [Kiritimatiellia bacterium]
MVSEKVDLGMAEASTRRMQAEADANYIAQTQSNARLSTQTKYVNMDTGEVSWGKPFENTPPAATATETVAPDGGPGSLAGDPDAGARHVKIAITFVLVVILTWVWFAQKRAAARAS